MDDGVMTALTFMARRPEKLPREPHAGQLLAGPEARALGEARRRLAAKLGRDWIEGVCTRCGGIFRPSHIKRVRCDGCVRAEKRTK